MKANTMRNNGITFSLDTIFFLVGGGEEGRGVIMTFIIVFLFTGEASLLFKKSS